MGDGKKIDAIGVISLLTVILQLVKVILEMNNTIKITDTLFSAAIIILILVLYFIYANKLKKRIRDLTTEKEVMEKKNIELEHYINNFSLRGKSFVSTVQYIIDSVERKVFNNVSMRTVNITYKLKDGTIDQNHLDMNLTYDFNGKNKTGSDINNIFLKTAIDFNDNKKYITATARDCREQNNLKFRPAFKYDNETNIITWTLPFEGIPLSVNQNFRYIVNLDWKNFFEKENITTILIDPKNYSLDTEEIILTFINNSQLLIDDIHILEFIRKPLENKNEPLRMHLENDEWKITLNPEEDVVYILCIICK